MFFFFLLILTLILNQGCKNITSLENERAGEVSGMVKVPPWDTDGLPHRWLTLVFFPPRGMGAGTEMKRGEDEVGNIIMSGSPVEDQGMRHFTIII